MRYLLAILLPPFAVLACGKPFQFLLNIVLCFFLWVPAVIHAFCVVSTYNADKRNEKLIQAINTKGKAAA